MQYRQICFEILPFIAAKMSADESSSVNSFTFAPFLISVWTILSKPAKKMFKKKINTLDKSWTFFCKK